MNKRKFKRELGKMLKERFKEMPKRIAKGAWGTRPRADRKTSAGVVMPMLDIVNMESGKVQLVMPEKVFEQAMKKAGFKRDDQPEEVQAVSQNGVPAEVREMAQVAA